ncbi:MAG: hypothetical protein R3E01_13205 [Pirellulaceae bacterium]
MNENDREVLWEFARHVILGTLVFLLIYAPAVLLNVLVHWLKHCGWVNGLIFAIEGAEWTLVIADTSLYVVFLFKTSWDAAAKLLRQSETV